MIEPAFGLLLLTILLIIFITTTEQQWRNIKKVLTMFAVQ